MIRNHSVAGGRRSGGIRGEDIFGLWPNHNKFRDSEFTIMFSEKQQPTLVWAYFFPIHLEVILLVSMQKKCKILQQSVQSNYTLPTYAIQACVQGTYMCS